MALGYNYLYFIINPYDNQSLKFEKKQKIEAQRVFLELRLLTNFLLQLFLCLSSLHNSTCFLFHLLHHYKLLLVDYYDQPYTHCESENKPDYTQVIHILHSLLFYNLLISLLPILRPTCFKSLVWGSAD